MKSSKLWLLGFCILSFNVVVDGKNYYDIYPTAQIANNQVQMRLYLPDTINGYYRASRFDWSGIIAETNYKGHSYFGEWKDTHDPYNHDDITGPVEGSIYSGLGYDEASVGEEYIRLGVGVLHKQAGEFFFNKTYDIVNHGKWKITKGKDWIQFQHTISSSNGYAYIYTKRIELLKNKPGFVMKHTLVNTGSKTIVTDQFNHNFFTIDKGVTGTGFSLRFKFTPEILDTKYSLGFFEAKNDGLVFSNDLLKDFVFAMFKPLPANTPNFLELINKKSGAGVRVSVNKPMNSLVFWARSNVFCPENSVIIKVEKGKSMKWDCEYTLFESKSSE